jgi:flagellar protein FlbD
MINVSRLNGKEYYINPHLVEFIEETPDTVITLTTGKKIVVDDSAAQIVEKILNYRAQIATRLPKIVTGDER